VRALPRLSVDIDLAFLPTQPWIEAIENVESSMQNIAVNIQKSIKDAKVHQSKNSSTNRVEKIFVSQSGAQTKIEPNPVIRGSVFPSLEMSLVDSAAELFQMLRRACFRLPISMVGSWWRHLIASTLGIFLIPNYC
jgi:Nucleotidyl transferase AbiEii toxin, Type IV TA system